MAEPRSSSSRLGRMLRNPCKTNSQAQTPEEYLRLVEQYVHRVQEMTSEGSNVEVYHEQCRYLARRLEMVVTLLRRKDFDTTLPCSSRRYAEESLKVCKLLYHLVNGAESFIRNCCNDNWMHTAMILTDVSKHVATRTFHSELLMLRLHKILGSAELTPERTELESLYTNEFNVVQATSSVDQGILMKRLENVIHASNNPKDDQFRLATYVLQRLRFQEAQSHSSHLEVEYGSLQRKETLGKGRIGTVVVHKTIWLGAEVAAKTFSGEELHLIFRDEVSILQRLSHPNIVPLLCYATNKPQYSIVMELMDSDLNFLIRERFQSSSNCNVPFTMEESVGIMLQVAEAMNHIHEKRILHRDLKSHNILVKYVKGKGVLHVKVADFGISKEQEHSSTFSCQSLHKGTTRWMAPEVIADPRQTQSSSGSEEVLKYPFKSDIYSFGMLCYEILTGNDPFWKIRSLSEVKQKVLRGEHPELPLMCPPDLTTLIVSCWKFEARARPSFKEICKALQYIHWCIFLEHDQEEMKEKPRKEAEFAHNKPQSGGERHGCTPKEGNPGSYMRPKTYYSDLQPRTLSYDDDNRTHMDDDLRFKPMILKEDISNLKLKRRLGRGGSENGDVFLSTWHHHSNVQDVAQKMFLVRDNGNAGSFRNEVLIMAKLNHPNIVRFLCYAEDGRTRSIVIELMDGDLNDLLKRRLAEDTTHAVPFSLNEALDMMLQIAAAMNYLHQNNIVHRDLKSDNILFKNVMEGIWNIKVADFGLSKGLQSQDKYRHSHERAPYGRDVATYRGNIGTIRWMAPELMSIQGNVDEDDTSLNLYRSDVYSFAMVCFEILTGQVPFSGIQDSSEVQTKVMEGERPVLPNQCPPKLKALIGRCWHPVTHVRPRFATIIEELEVILWEQYNYQSLGT